MEAADKAQKWLMKPWDPKQLVSKTKIEVKVQPNLVKNEEVKLAKSTNDKHIRRPFDAILIRALFLTWSLESFF